MITIVIPKRAITKDNDKSFKTGGGYFLPERFRAFETVCALYARKVWTGRPMEAELVCNIDFYFKTRVCPDLFNLPKSVADALTGIVWKDDRQIVDGRLRKIFGESEERIVLTIGLAE